MPSSLFDLCKAAGHDVFSGPPLEGKEVIRVSGGDTVNAPEWWYQRNGYRRLASLHGEFGQTSALQLSAVFACVKIIGEDVGSLPLHVFRRSADSESREKDRRHPLYRLLHDAPNPETTAIEFREALTANAALCGNGFAKIERSSGRIIALWQLQPDAVTIDKDSRRQTVYVWKDGNEPEETLSWDEVLHLRGFSLDARIGLSFIRMAKRTLALAREQEDYAQDFFDNDHTPSVVLKYAAVPKSPEDIPNIRKAWLDSITRHGVAVAHSGVDVENLSSTNTDAQLTEQRVFELLQVCRYFRMPPHKLAELSRATFSNIEQQQIDYYTGTLRPWLVRWEQAISRCCFSVAERVSNYVEHDIAGLLRGDFRTQTEGFAKLLEKGVLSVNEVRRMMNLNPVDGGDERFIQLNMQSLVNAANGEPAQEPEPVAAPAAAAGQSRLFRIKSL